MRVIQINSPQEMLRRFIYLLFILHIFATIFAFMFAVSYFGIEHLGLTAYCIAASVLLRKLGVKYMEFKRLDRFNLFDGKSTDNPNVEKFGRLLLMLEENKMQAWERQNIRNEMGNLLKIDEEVVLQYAPYIRSCHPYLLKSA